MDQALEFDRQVENLIQKGYHKLVNMTANQFSDLFQPLKTTIQKLDLSNIDLEHGYLPFVIVIKRDLVPTDQAMPLVKKDGKIGIIKLFPHNPSDFNTIPNVSIPKSNIYLLTDIDRGKGNINQPPSEAMKKILEQNRSPINIDEGVAIVTHYPEFLTKNNCFSLLASRHAEDKKVPAIWINSNKNPNLGWCWDGNPHTWLGSASCKGRIASTS